MWVVSKNLGGSVFNEGFGLHLIKVPHFIKSIELKAVRFPINELLHEDLIDVLQF